MEREIIRISRFWLDSSLHLKKHAGDLGWFPWQPFMVIENSLLCYRWPIEIDKNDDVPMEKGVFLFMATLNYQLYRSS